MLDTNNSRPCVGISRNYKRIGLNKKQIMDRIGQSADHCFRWESSQWDLCTPETYQQLINEFGIRDWFGFREYESLRQEYESLRQEYESLRPVRKPAIHATTALTRVITMFGKVKRAQQWATARL